MDAIRLRETNRKYADPIHVSLVCQQDATSEIRQGFGYSYEYFAEITVGTAFRANDLQLDRAKENAVRYMAHWLYSDIEREILGAMKHTYDEQVLQHLRSALDIINEQR